MSRRAWKVVLVLGIAATGFGAKLVLDQYSVYWPDHLPPTLAFTGGGLLALALALAKLVRPVVGIAVFVLGAGATAGVLRLGAARMDEMERGWAQERVVSEAAEAVCKGTPNAAAAAPGGSRPIMQVTTRPDSDSPTTMFANEWEGLAKPKTLAELQLVVCRVQHDQYVSSCDYAGANGATFHITKSKTVDALTVKDAKTGQVLGEKTFEGSEPSTQCDDSITTYDTHATSSNSSGGPPSDQDETAFVRSFVEPAAK